MPRPLFPDPVCKLSGEYGLIAAVLAAPLDDLPKLVYADWLDEHDDPRGLFLRTWLAARKAGKRYPKAEKSLGQCWLSVVGFTLDDTLKRMGRPAWGEAVQALSAPGVMVRTIPLKDGETVPTGRSKMGGLPDLLPDQEWPEGEDGPGAMVAQWNLAELAVSPCAAKLPEVGLLSFFMDMVHFEDGAEEPFTKVLFTPDPAEVEEREPDDTPHDFNDLPACRVEFREYLSLPDPRSPALAKRLTAEALADYVNPHAVMPAPRGEHRILGHHSSLQSDPTPSGAKKTWSLLTQFGVDEDLRLEADGGTWYFMTPTADLKKGKFDGTRMEFQTG